MHGACWRPRSYIDSSSTAMDKSNFIYSFYQVPYFSHSSNPQLAVAFKPFLSMYFFLSPSYFQCSFPVAGRLHSSRHFSRVLSTGRGFGCFPLCCVVGMAVGAVHLSVQPGSMTVSFLSYFLSLKSIWFPFSALQCQLINHSASRLILDKTISLSLPAVHKASMYRIKFVVLFPDKNELR